MPLSRWGYGWGFGVHEALDQLGALIGPLALALILALKHNDYERAFASLALPAAVMLSVLAVPDGLPSAPGS